MKRLRRTWVDVCLLAVVAGGLRFATLRLQSYDFDEAWTLSVIHGSFWQMLHAVARSESTPPLYYVLAWVWARIFGFGEIGLRSMSAVAGVATVPVVYGVGRALASRRVGLVAAGIVATSPYLVFYSQEARSYALFTLLATLGVLCSVRALQHPTGRTFCWWAAASAAAIAAHYFALFLWVGEIAALALFRAPRRLLVWSSAAVTLVAIPLLALAEHQASGGHVDWIGSSSLSQRVRVTIETFALGATFRGSLSHSILALCGLLSALMAAAIAVALILVVRRGTLAERRAAQFAGLIALVAIAIPLVAAVVHKDYFLHKNLIPVVPLLAVVLAAGLGCRKAGRVGTAGAIVLGLAGTALTVLSFAATSMRRPDVRQVSERLGVAKQARIVIFVPRWQMVFEHYQGPMNDLPANGRRVNQIDVFTTSASLPPGTVPKAFRLVGLQHGDTFNLFRFRSNVPVLVAPADLGHQTFSESGLQPIAVFEDA